MEFREVVGHRRMVHRFARTPVPPEVLERILDVGRRGPTAGFAQGIEFLILDEPQAVADFWELTDDPRFPMEPDELVDAPPALVLPIPDRDRYLARYAEEDKAPFGLQSADAWPVPFWDTDAAMAAMLMLLAAVDEGLGGGSSASPTARRPCCVASRSRTGCGRSASWASATRWPTRCRRARARAGGAARSTTCSIATAGEPPAGSRGWAGGRPRGHGTRIHQVGQLERSRRCDRRAEDHQDEVRAPPHDRRHGRAVRVRTVQPIGFVAERGRARGGRTGQLPVPQIGEVAPQRRGRARSTGEHDQDRLDDRMRGVSFPPSTRSAGTKTTPFANSNPSSTSCCSSVASRAKETMSWSPEYAGTYPRPGRCVRGVSWIVAMSIRGRPDRLGAARCGRRGRGRARARGEGEQRRDRQTPHPSCVHHDRRYHRPMRDLHALPKVELHIHLEGSVRVPTLRELADRSGVLSRTASAGGSDWRFDGFLDFIDNYIEACALLSAPEDFRRVAEEFCADLAANGVRYAEAVFSPSNHAARLGDWYGPIEAVLDGLEAGRRVHGVQVQLCPDLVRDNGVEEAERTLEVALKFAGRGVVALNAAGSERAPVAAFAPMFRRAKDAGLRSVPHAGEWAGPQNVWDTLATVEPDRIGHGVRVDRRSASGRGARERASRSRSRPSRTWRPASYPSLADSVPPVREAGVVVTLNSSTTRRCSARGSAASTTRLGTAGASRTPSSPSWLAPGSRRASPTTPRNGRYWPASRRLAGRLSRR